MPGLSISINARQRCIIYALLKSESHLTLNSLSKQSGLTPRIIRYNLETVKTWFRYEKVTLRSRPGYGIEIDADRQTRKRLLALISTYDENNLILTRSQRQRISLFELLTAHHPLTYHELASNQGISRSTIVHDIKAMQCWLNSYGITLIKTPNKGVYLECGELSRRFALLNIIREELGEQKWYSMWYFPDLSSILDKSLPPNLENYLKYLPLDYCHSTVSHIENLIGYRMALYSRLELMIYLAISIDALLNYRYLEEPAEHVQPEFLEMEVAQAIFTDINRKLQISNSQYEIELLAASLMGAKWQEDTRANLASGRHKTDFENRYLMSLRYADMIIETCARQIHPLLQVDSELITELTRHLEPVLFRMRYRLPILNDLLSQVVDEYPEVFHTTCQSVILIESEIGVNFSPEEIGFIAMYIVAAMNRLKTRDRDNYKVVILGDGIRAKTSLLKSRIEYEFPYLEIIDVLNGYIYNDEVLEQTELVLSILPGEMPGKPTIQVSPFLSASEKKLIQSWISEQESKERKLLTTTHKKQELVDLLIPRNIVFSNGPQNWRDAVRKASQPLLEFDCISSRYVQSMIAVIEEFGPYMLMAPGVIILHARPADGVNSLCLSMLVSDEKIKFGDSVHEMVDIAFVLGAIDEHSHIKALLQLSNLISQPEICQAIRQSNNPSDILRIAWSHPLQEISVP